MYSRYFAEYFSGFIVYLKTTGIRTSHPSKEVVNCRMQVVNNNLLEFTTSLKIYKSNNFKTFKLILKVIKIFFCVGSTFNYCKITIYIKKSI